MLFRSYRQIVFDPEQESQRLTVIWPDGRKETYTSGCDFYPFTTTEDLSISGPIDFDKNNSQLMVTATERNFVFLRSDRATAQIYSSTSSFKVPSELFDLIKDGESLSLEGRLETSDVEVSNVVGVFPGRNRSQALLITAHFDHVGGYEDCPYRGAVDNASGIAVLLEMLRLLGNTVTELPYDLVF